MTTMTSTPVPTYRSTKAPLEVGQVREKRWALLAGLPSAPWNRRAGDYWSLQERLYGFRVAQPVSVVLDDQSGEVVSRAIVAHVMAGTRVANYTPPGGMAALLASE